MSQVVSDRTVSRVHRRSRSRGSTLAEFAPALCILICGVMLPLLDFGFVPIRFAVAYLMVNNAVDRLALAKSPGNAVRELGEDSWVQRLASCGIKVKRTELALIVIDSSNQIHRFAAGQKGAIPKDLLPDPEKSLMIYQLELSTDLEISPLLTIQGKGIPGLTAPFPIKLSAKANWENLAGDPETGEYFLNE